MQTNLFSDNIITFCMYENNINTICNSTSPINEENTIVEGLSIATPIEANSTNTIVTVNAIPENEYINQQIRENEVCMCCVGLCTIS